MVKGILNSQIAENSRSFGGPAVIQIEVVLKQSIYGFSGAAKQPFLRIFTVNPKLISTVKNLLDKGIELGPYGHITLAPYESNIPFQLRFMIDTNVRSNLLCILRVPSNVL